MSKIKLKRLSKIGYTNDQVRTIALQVVSKYYKHHSEKEIEDLLVAILADPNSYMQDEVLQKIASCFVEKSTEINFKSYELNSDPKELKTYGSKFISTNAKKQMDLALKLPVAVRGALMPDAHAGYGLPIGGVLATENAVIPYGIGVDIGCRMALTVFDASERMFNQYHYQLKTALSEWTHFGMEGGLAVKQEHEVLDNVLFKEIALLKQLSGKAYNQLGSSGGGNHFVEWGLLDMKAQNKLNLKEGTYVALLSHSGSRGLGSNIAMHYFQKAMDVCKLPREVKHLAWLDLNTELGQEYWLAMKLAGDYAKACHDVIHKNLTMQCGFTPLLKVENHHNFAWRELVDERELIVHRKGATPAADNELGIIPGSMVHKGYLVSGKGNISALSSASHGAGRAMSRIMAKNSNTVSDMKKILANHNVTLIGGSTEEAPAAYKDIEKVMDAQKDLVNIEGVFQPRIVRMNKE